jgi:hypothetical protein
MNGASKRLTRWFAVLSVTSMSVLAIAVIAAATPNMFSV